MAARGWSASRAAWAFTLLLLAAFTGSISLGAGSVGVAVVAFLFLLAAIAVATAARAKDYFRAYPADTSPVADFHIDDLKVDDDTSAAGLDGSDSTAWPTWNAVCGGRPIRTAVRPRQARSRRLPW